MQKIGNNNSPKLIKAVFIPVVLFFIVLIVWGLTDNDGFAATMSVAQSFVMKYIGSPTILLGAVSLFAVAFVAFSKYGKIVIGGPDAKPEFNFYQWFAMTLCGGISVAIMFWGVAEPLTHFMAPPANLGVEGGTPEAALIAMDKTYLHYTFYVYGGLQTIVTVAVAYFGYNRGLPLKGSSALYPIIGDNVNKWPGKVFDVFSIIALVGGAITALVFGVEQITNLMGGLFNVKESMGLWLAIICVTVAIFTLSSYTGIKRGIKYLSSFNFGVYIAFLLLAFFFGNILFTIDLGIESVGHFFNNFIDTAMQTDAFNQSGDWYDWWTGFYYLWYIAYAPVLAVFFSRIAKGRTLRSMIAMNALVVCIFEIVWFVVFGGNGIWKQYSGELDLWSLVSENGADVAMVEFIKSYPGGISTIMLILALLGVVIGYCTAQDSVCTSLSIMVTDFKKAADTEPPGHIKITWGLIMGAMTIVILLIGNGSAVKMFSCICAVPIVFFIVLAIIGLCKEFFGKNKRLALAGIRKEEDFIEENPVDVAAEE